MQMPTTNPKNTPLNTASFRRVERMSMLSRNTATAMPIAIAIQLYVPNVDGSLMNDHPTAAIRRTNRARRMCKTISPRERVRHPLKRCFSKQSYGRKDGNQTVGFTGYSAACGIANAAAFEIG